LGGSSEEQLIKLRATGAIKVKVIVLDFFITPSGFGDKKVC
jgi:hypothetical protein